MPCSRSFVRWAPTTPRNTRAPASASRSRGSSWSCTVVASGSRVSWGKDRRSPSRCRGAHGRRADPRRRGQREEPQARARCARACGLPTARGRIRRRRCAARARAPPRAGADGHPARRHQRHRGAPPAAGGAGNTRHPRYRRDRLGHDRRSRQDHGRRLRRLPVQAHQRAPVPRRRPRSAGSGSALVSAPKILVVDDTPSNVKLLADILGARGYAVVTAASGVDALETVERERPDLVLLDVMMPGMSGYDVCRKLRANPVTMMLPVVMITALDPGQERVKGIEAGADDFLSKPINQPEILARVRSLLRVKSLYDELTELNWTLERRVTDQVAQLERLSRLKRFFSPALAEAIVTGGADDPLKSHRREIVVVFVDLRGFTAFAETSEPEEVMSVLRDYHAAMGEVIVAHEGTLERFTGDGMMVFFNDPEPVPDPQARALRMALAMRARVETLTGRWRKLGFDLHVGIGIAQGYATLGAIGFEGRWDYGAIGTVTNLAARLCGEARGGQILVSRRLYTSVEQLVEVEPLGELTLRGFARPVTAFNVLKGRAAE